MENLNAEQIKKGLVCCTSFDDLCGECPIDQNKKDDCSCALFLEQNALALINSQEQRIKELTEEKESLKQAMEHEHASFMETFGEYGEKCDKLTEENERLKQKRMNKIDIYKALDILDKFDFFQGQRAGRELWSEKPFEVQEEDLKKFSMDVELLKDFVEDIAHKLKCDELQIEAKERICESYMLQYGTAADKEVWLKKERADTIMKLQERLDKHFCHDPAFLGVEQRLIMGAIDQIAKEMLEGEK